MHIALFLKMTYWIQILLKKIHYICKIPFSNKIQDYNREAV